MRGCPPGHVPLERALSKRGLCSRSQARALIAAGRVRVDGVTAEDPGLPVRPETAQLELDGSAAEPATTLRYLALNKPRGLVTTAEDERGRETVYRCFVGADLPWLAPVGRLDRASEGLLLFTNDTRWAEAVLDPGRGPAKTYHVQVERVPDDDELAALRAGIDDAEETLHAQSIELLRSGGRSAWLTIVLKGGRNRHIRRMLAARDLNVKRLIRIAIGPLALGDLGKGAWRELTGDEVAALLPRDQSPSSAASGTRTRRNSSS